MKAYKFEHRTCGIMTLLNYHPSEHFQEQLVGCLKQKCLVWNVRVQSRRRQHDGINQVSEVNDEVVLMNRRMVWLTAFGIHYLLCKDVHAMRVWWKRARDTVNLPRTNAPLCCMGLFSSSSSLCSVDTVGKQTLRVKRLFFLNNRMDGYLQHNAIRCVRGGRMSAMWWLSLIHISEPTRPY